MVDVIERYNRAKKQVEDAERIAAEARGAATAALATLKERFGVDSVEAARALHGKWEGELVALEAELSAALDEFERATSEGGTNGGPVPG